MSKRNLLNGVVNLHSYKEEKKLIIECMEDYAEAYHQEKIKEELSESNEMIRSLHSVCERKGKNTNWDALTRKTKLILEKQHKLLYPK